MEIVLISLSFLLLMAVGVPIAVSLGVAAVATPMYQYVTINSITPRGVHGGHP